MLFKTSVVVLVVVVFAILAAVEYHYLPNSKRQDLYKALERKGLAVAGLTVHGVSTALEFDDTQAVREYFDSAAQDPDIAYLAAYREDGSSPVTHIVGEHQPQFAPTRSQITTSIEPGVLRVFAPLPTGLGATGLLAIGYSTASIEKQHKRNQDVALYIGLVIAGLGLVLAAMNVLALRRAERYADEKRAAEAVTAAKGAFLAHMSHEIRTPLNGVLGMASLLLRSGLNSKQRNFARAIKRSGEGLNAILSDLLDFSKIDVGEVALERRAFRLDQLLEDITEMAGAMLLDKSEVEFVCLQDPQLPPSVVGDSTRLQQILMNLISNAVKFTARGEVVLEATAVQDQRVRLSVSDTGIGIPKAQQKKLFRAFSQADSSTTRKYGGTGLGLVISQRLCELMGGCIELESSSGVGSCFSFDIELPSQPAQRLTWGVEGLCVATWSGSPLQTRALEQTLERLAVRASRAPSAVAALQTAHRQQMAAAIVDDYQGRNEVLEALASHKANHPSGPQIVLLSTLSADAAAPNTPFPVTVLCRPVRAEALAKALMGTHTRLERINSLAPAIRPLNTHGRALVVDDNPTNREVLSAFLDLLGYEWTQATDGAQAVQAVQADPTYDVIFLDWEMPNMDGPEASRRIRAHEEATGCRRARIVSVTAHAVISPEDRLAMAADAYLSKPVQLGAIRQVLTNSLSTLALSERSERSECAEPIELVDRSIFDALLSAACESHPTLVIDLIQTFNTDAERRLGEMRCASAAQDEERLAAAIHALKGGAYNIGASALAQALEAWSVTVEEAECEQFIASTESLLKKTSSLLSRLAQDGSAKGNC